jgi:hypothetical protein
LQLTSIESLILKGDYDEALKDLSFAIKKYNSQNNQEKLYNALNYLNLICDKSPKIALKTVKIIENLINDQDSWIRVVSLEIIFQISMYRPNLLIYLFDDIVSRLYDCDDSVRRLTVKIIGKLLLTLHIDSEKSSAILTEFTEKLMDNDWKVKLNVITTIKKLINQDYTRIKSLEPLFSMVIINLRDKDEEVSQAAAELLKLIGLYYISKEKIFYVLLHLLYNEKPRVKKLIVWLFGEIGREKSSEIIPFIPKIINFLTNKNYGIRYKVIETLTIIAKNNFEQIWANLINSISNFDNNPGRQVTREALYHLSKANIDKIFPYLFKELDNPSENVREIVVATFKQLYKEYQLEIEKEITKILSEIESKYWRKRKKSIELLEKLNTVLNEKKIAIWLYLELKKFLDKEHDLTVKKEIEYTLDKVESLFPSIKKIIEKIMRELSFLNEKIQKFQKIPAEFRKKINSYIKNFKFNTTEIQLNQLYDDIIKKIHDFNQKINNFQYKRIAFDLIEDWKETKIQIIDEISLIRGSLSKLCEEKKQEYIATLKSKINILMDRITILKAQFDYIKEESLDSTILENIETRLYSETALQEKFNYISLIRKNFFKLDIDIREILINNSEFDELFKDLINKWISVKIDIQVYLNKIDKKIKLLKQQIIEKVFSIKSSDELTNFNDEKNINDKLTFQIVQSHINSIITYGINGIKKLNHNLDHLKIKLDSLMRKGDFKEARKIIEMNSSQIKSFIDNTDEKIDNIIETKRIFKPKSKSESFDLYINPILEKWEKSKELMIYKLKKFLNKNNRTLFLFQIKHYLNIMNPLSLELLAANVGIERERIEESLLSYIDKDKLDAKIIDGKVIAPKIGEEFPKFRELNLFKNIKTVGNHLEMNLRLNNPSNYDFNELKFTLKLPPYLILLDESHPKFFQIDNLKSGKDFRFNYKFKIDKELKDDYEKVATSNINLEISYKGPHNISKSMFKKIDFILI